jgi:N-acetylglucosamine-6-phosphate deacetylase
MDHAVRHVARQWGVERAVRMASAVPARLLGGGSGEIRAGMRADLVLLDGALRVRTVVASGRLVHAPV